MALTLDEGKDPIDGSETNAVRRQALELLDRTIDDMTDAELFGRAPDQFWFIDLCLDKLHRLPSEVDQVLTCREYTQIQAYHIVKRAQDMLQRAFREPRGHE